MRDYSFSSNFSISETILDGLPVPASEATSSSTTVPLPFLYFPIIEWEENRERCVYMKTNWKQYNKARNRVLEHN